MIMSPEIKIIKLIALSGLGMVTKGLTLFTTVTSFHLTMQNIILYM